MRTAVIVLIALCVGSTALAQVQQDKSLISAGGSLMTGGTTQLNANLGDVFTGVSWGGTTEVQHGFWTSPENQVISVEEPRVTFVYFLAPARPNPSRESTVIEFGLPVEEQDVKLRIYDVSGRLIRELVRGTMPAGIHRAVWDLRSEGGTAAATGVYFCHISTSSFSSVRRFVVIR